MSPSKVVISADLARREARYALAHELGHVLCRRGELPSPLSSRDDERQADQFARALLLPDVNTIERHAAAQSAERFDVDLPVVVTRLAAAGLTPQIVRTASGTVCCAACGFMPRSLLCECARFRSSELLAADLLAVA